MKNKILKKFEATDVTIEIINGVPMFELYSTGMALGYVNKRTSKGKEYISPYKSRIDKIAKSAGITGLCQGVTTYMTENELYDFMLEAHTEKCKPFRKWIVNEVLPMINTTGAYMDQERIPEVMENYFSGLSDDVKEIVFEDLRKNNKILQEKNAELQQFYDTLINTEGLLPMNTVAKELNIGLKRLYLFLRNNGVMFYKGNVNIPYQRFMEQGLFEVKETPCHDGNYRPVSYATRKGLEYIRKLLVKNQLCAE